MQDWSTYTDDQIRDYAVQSICRTCSQALRDLEEVLEEAVRKVENGDNRRFIRIVIDEIEILLSFRAQLEPRIGPRCDRNCDHGTCELIRHMELDREVPEYLPESV